MYKSFEKYIFNIRHLTKLLTTLQYKKNLLLYNKRNSVVMDREGDVGLRKVG